MQQTRNRLFGGLATLLLCAGPAQAAAVGAEIPAPRDVPYPGVIQLQVDATDLDHRVFRVKETLPVAGPGRTTLLYPKWLPGNHSTTGPIDKLAGLIVRSDDTFSTVSLDYHDGLRYPHLERIEKNKRSMQQDVSMRTKMCSTGSGCSGGG